MKLTMLMLLVPLMPLSDNADDADAMIYPESLAAHDIQDVCREQKAEQN